MAQTGFMTSAQVTFYLPDLRSDSAELEVRVKEFTCLTIIRLYRFLRQWIDQSKLNKVGC